MDINHFVKIKYSVPVIKYYIVKLVMNKFSFGRTTIISFLSLKNVNVFFELVVELGSKVVALSLLSP